MSKYDVTDLKSNIKFAKNLDRIAREGRNGHWTPRKNLNQRYILKSFINSSQMALSK